MPPLPHFRFHPDPVATGSIVPSDEPCACCEQERGYVYVGPVYSKDGEDPTLCPWCIADGSAHARFGVSFHDVRCIGGVNWNTVPQASIEEVAYRTPGFSGWQPERWWSHCGEAACFLGRVGCDELEAAGPLAIEGIRTSIGLPPGEEWDEIFEQFDKEGSPTAYLFRCGTCGAFGGDWDCD